MSFLRSSCYYCFIFILGLVLVALASSCQFLVEAWQFKLGTGSINNVLLARYSSSYSWKTVCDDSFTSDDLYTIAHASWGLNLSTNQKLGWRNTRDYRARSYGIELVNIRCSAMRSSFPTSCSYSRYGNYYCSHFEDVVVNTAIPEINYEITRTPDNLLLAKNDTASSPGLVCDDYFDYATAEAFCTFLGKNKTKVIWHSATPAMVNRSNATTFALDDVQCPASATNFSKSCVHRLYGGHNCGKNYESVVLYCDSSDRVPLRFRQSSSYVLAYPGVPGKSSYFWYGWQYITAKTYSQHTLNILCRESGFLGAVLQSYNGSVVGLNISCARDTRLLYRRTGFRNFHCPDSATSSKDCDFDFDARLITYPSPSVPVLRLSFPKNLLQVKIEPKSNLVLVVPNITTPNSPSALALKGAATICQYYVTYSSSRDELLAICRMAGFDTAVAKKKKIFWHAYAPVSGHDTNHSIIGQFVSTSCATSATDFAQCYPTFYNYQSCSTASLYGSCDGSGIAPYIDLQDNGGLLKLRDRHNYLSIPVRAFSDTSYTDPTTQNVGIISPTTAAAMCHLAGHLNVTASSVEIFSKFKYRPYYYTRPRYFIVGLACSRINISSLSECDYEWKDYYYDREAGSTGNIPHVGIRCTTPKQEWKFTYAPGTRIVLAETPAGLGNHINPGPICSSGSSAVPFNMYAARFICKKLAARYNFTFSPDHVYIRTANSSELRLANSSVAVSGMTCVKNANSSGDCQFIETGSCYYRYVVSLHCDVPSWKYAFRLDNSSNVVLARAVNASVSGAYTEGTICGLRQSQGGYPGFARAVCHALGYKNLSKAFGWARGPVLGGSLNSLRNRVYSYNCPDDAESIEDCSIEDYYSRGISCSTYYNLAVSCSDQVPFSIQRLRYTSDVRIAPLGYFYYNSFSGESYSFSNLQTRIALCKMAGYSQSSSSSNVPYWTRYCSTSGYIYSSWITNISCPSSATSLSDCDWVAGTASNCYSRLYCRGALEPWKFRIRSSDKVVLATPPGTMSQEGTFEYYFSPTYRLRTGHVICRAMLGSSSYALSVGRRTQRNNQADRMSVCSSYCYSSNSAARFDYNGPYCYVTRQFACLRTFRDTLLTLRCANGSTSVPTPSVASTTIPTTTTAYAPPPTTTTAKTSITGEHERTQTPVEKQDSTTAGMSTTTPGSTSYIFTTPTQTISDTTFAPSASPSTTATSSSNTITDTSFPTTTSPSSSPSSIASSSSSSPTTTLSPGGATATTTSTSSVNASSADSSLHGGAAHGGASSGSNNFQETGLPVIVALLIIILLVVLYIAFRRNRKEKEEQEKENNVDMNVQLMSDQANAQQSLLATQQSGLATHTGFAIASFLEDGNTGGGTAIASQPTQQGAGGIGGMTREVSSITSAKTHQEMMEEELLAAVAPTQSFAFPSSTPFASSSSSVAAPPSATASASSVMTSTTTTSSMMKPESNSGEEGESDSTSILNAVAKALLAPTAATAVSSALKASSSSSGEQETAKNNNKKEKHDEGEKGEEVVKPERMEKVAMPLGNLASASAAKKWKQKTSTSNNSKKKKEAQAVEEVVEAAITLEDL